MLNLKRVMIVAILVYMVIYIIIILVILINTISFMCLADVCIIYYICMSKLVTLCKLTNSFLLFPNM